MGNSRCAGKKVGCDVIVGERAAKDSRVKITGAANQHICAVAANQRVRATSAR